MDFCDGTRVVHLVPEESGLSGGAFSEMDYILGEHDKKFLTKKKQTTEI